MAKSWQTSGLWPSRDATVAPSHSSLATDFACLAPVRVKGGSKGYLRPSIDLNLGHGAQETPDAMNWYLHLDHFDYPGTIWSTKYCDQQSGGFLKALEISDWFQILILIWGLQAGKKWWQSSARQIITRLRHPAKKWTFGKTFHVPPFIAKGIICSPTISSTIAPFISSMAISGISGTM